MGKVNDIRCKVESLIVNHQGFQQWLEGRDGNSWYSVERGLSYNALAKWLQDQLKPLGVNHVEVSDDTITIVVGQDCICIEMPDWMRTFRVYTINFHYPFKVLWFSKNECLEVLRRVVEVYRRIEQKCSSEQQFTCPTCGAKVQVQLQHPAGCGGNPEWHDEGAGGVEVIIESEDGESDNVRE
jgi:hypothetical protein